MPSRRVFVTAIRRGFSWAFPVALVAVLFLVMPGAAPSLAQGGPPAGLPEQASVQAGAQFEGELEVQFECEDKRSRLLHTLRTANGRRLKLRFEGAPPDLPSGSRVRVKGRLQDEETLALSASDPGSVQALSLATPNTFGQQRVIVILVNFQDNGSTPYSAASAQTTTFQSVNTFYAENSYGQTSLSGDVYGWYTIPMSGSVCDTTKIASLAEEAAVNLGGANLSAYTRRIYAFPNISACTFWGRGSVGGSPSRAWINGSYATQVVAHELGHNFGNYHSHSQPCAAGACSSVEYGDNRDIMGQTAVAHTTAFQKERLGWLNYGSSPPVQIVGLSGTYWIDGYAQPGSAPKALKILKGLDASGKRTWYYVEARTKFGFDASITPGVLVHTGSESSPSSSYQIDLDPVTSAFDSLLDPGQTFSDPAIGFNVKALWADATGAMVDVTLDSPPCAESAPTVTFSPSSTVSAQPGRAAGVGMTVRNNDAAGCGSAVFNLSSAVPSGWLAAFDRASITLEPGATAFADLSLTPPSTAAGQYGFSAAASRSGPSASASGTVVVAAGLEVFLSIGESTKTGYPLSATVRIGGQAAAGASVAFAVTAPGGATTTLSVTSSAAGAATVKWRPRKTDPAGTYQVLVKAAASGLEGSASGTIVR